MKKSDSKKKDMIPRSVKLKVRFDNSLKIDILNSIRTYRSVCRKAFSVVGMSEMAGAEIKISGKDGEEMFSKVVMNSDAAKAIRETIFDKSGKAHLYEMRDWIRSQHPSWQYHVCESIQKDIVGPRWRAKDPEKNNLTRGFLVVSGGRAFAKFMNVGIPFKNNLPKISDHSITLTWDSEIGPVEFKVGDLDPSTWSIWRKIVSGEEGFKLGTTFLKENDGKISLVVSYNIPKNPKTLDTDKLMYIHFGDESDKFIVMSDDKSIAGRCLSVASIIEWSHEISMVEERYKSRISSYGFGNGGTGYKKGLKAMRVKQHKLAIRRANGVRSHNHNLAHRVFSEAVRRNAGHIVMVDVPSLSMFDIPWAWSQFKFNVEYRMKAMKGKVSYVSTKKMSEVSDDSTAECSPEAVVLQQA